MDHRSFKPTRRAALKGGLTAIAATSVPALLIGQTITSLNVRVDLEVVEVNGLPTYNGQVPGPTITLDSGGMLDVQLTNSLPALHDDCTNNPNAFHGLNTTNLHTHGLHVSPTTDRTGTYDADNVFVSVVPKGQIVSCAEVCGEDVATTFREGVADFRFEIGPDHPAGTFWYHAHKHGSTQRQVGAGLAGPLIVPDPPGSMPDYIAQAPEKVLMLMNRGLILTDPAGGGEVDPTIVMHPGEVQRWRIINAQAVGNAFAYLAANIPDLEVYLIAFDGLTLPRRIPIDLSDNREPWLNPAALAPGNRMDLIVRAPLNMRRRIIPIGITTGLTDLLSFGSNTTVATLQIDITGGAIDAPWSDDDTLPGPGLVPFGNEILPKRTVDFTPRFTIDGAPYDGVVAHTVELGAVEEWTVTNSTGGVHAFHIHVNPFFITHINGVELAEDDPLRRWQDTIGLPYRAGGQDGSVTYKTRFETFRGKFVIHCHVLRHEDLGMMQTVEVV